MTTDIAIAAIRRLGQGARCVEDAVSYSLGHRVRIEIRAALHEGPATAAQLAKIVDEPRSNLDYHIKEMLRDGSIAIAKTVKVGNMEQHYYCVVELPYFSDDDVAEMGLEDRQALYAMIVQASTAEALAALWAGKMVRDPRVMVAWNRINLDRRGRNDLADEEMASWQRKHEIEVESANRRAKTGERGVTYVITALAYERSRTSPPEPLSALEPPTKEGRIKGLAALQHLGKAERCVEDAVSYSLGHRLRIEIRAALHEGLATASQLSKIVRKPLNNVDYHLKEMLKDGSIDIAKTEKVGNIEQHYYSVVSLPYFSDEEVAAMSVEERQALYAMIVQAASAEALASLWAGKMVNDPRAFLSWNRINLDKQGRNDLADEEVASWQRKHEIEARSADRRAETGEPGITYIITSFGYERSRTSAPSPLQRNHSAPNKA